MLFAPEHIKIDEVANEVLKIEGVKNIHHVHIWQLNDHGSHLEAHIEFTKNIKLSEFDVICEKIEKMLLEKYGINHSNFQPEYIRDDEKDLIKQD